MIDDRIGPAFDTNILSRPTCRKLAGCWVESSGLPTLLLPKVWDELTQQPEKGVGSMTSAGWLALRRFSPAPFKWVELTSEQLEFAHEIRSSFTEGCFLGVPCDRIHRHPDAIITSQAIALGTDALVTGDIRTINHYEVNEIVEKRWGSNTGFVVTFDDALMRAHSGGRCAEQLLKLALTTIAPSGEWSVDQAHDDLETLRMVLARSNLPMVADALEIRWWCADDLDVIVADTLAVSMSSGFLRTERLRAKWHREGAIRPPTIENSQQQALSRSQTSPRQR